MLNQIESKNASKASQNITQVDPKSQSSTEIDITRVQRAKRKIAMGLMDDPTTVDRAVDELIKHFVEGNIDLISVDGESISGDDHKLSA